MNAWTPERRARQAALIRTWKPWQQATGPRTPDGKAKTSRNAYKGGHRLMLRELSRMVNAEVRAARDLVGRVSPCDRRKLVSSRRTSKAIQS